MESYDWNCLILKRGNLYTATYNVRTYQLLQSPYQTDCLHYDLNTEFTSRKDCIRKCKINRSLKRCSVVAHETDVLEGEPSVRFSNDTDEFDCVNRLGLNQLCHKQCHNNDCFKQHIEPNVMEDSAIAKLDNLTVLRFLIPFAPKTTFTHKPSIEPIEFVCYMASTLSMWFGFSLLSVGDLVRHLFTIKISSLKTNKINQNILFVPNYNHKTSNFQNVKRVRNIFTTDSGHVKRSNSQ